jgi:hypothetical protein
MWSCLSDGFWSLVADRNDPTPMMVRARREEHLVNMI